MWLRTDYLGGQPFDNTSTTMRHPLGFRARGQDAVYGDAEFRYTQATVALAAGQAITYNSSTGAVALATTRSKGLVGVPPVAIPLNSFGWVQVLGTAPVLVSGTVASGANLYSTATPGTLSSTFVSGDQVFGATAASANGTPAAGQALISLDQPYLGDTDNA